EGWNAINSNIIIYLFKYYGISNSIDKLEDDLIFNFNKVKSINNSREIEEDEEDNESELGDNSDSKSDYNSKLDNSSDRESSDNNNKELNYY
ncbi:hypothetical protein C1645_822263, partial [Glomus cerebriforme]